METIQIQAKLGRNVKYLDVDFTKLTFDLLLQQLHSIFKTFDEKKSGT